MLIKRYLFKDPKTDKVDVVFEYPDSLASPALIAGKGYTLVTRELLRLPILVMPDDYLMISDGYELDDCMYASFEYRNLYESAAKEVADGKKYDSKLQQVADLFSMGVNHKHTCKTMFFTGPKFVYKQTFEDDWTWMQHGILVLQSRGHFRTIDSLSLKGLNDVFITGTFECGDDVVENTQCKITLSRK